MTLSNKEISDRLEIQDLLYAYADAIDQKRFDDLRNVFDDDAHIDYSVYGGSVGNAEETIAFLKKALGKKWTPNYQHLNANMQIRVEGDRGHGRVMCFNPQEVVGPDGKNHTFMLGLWYVDEYVRTADGWRIRRRVEEKSWAFGAPDFIRLGD